MVVCDPLRCLKSATELEAGVIEASRIVRIKRSKSATRPPAPRHVRARFCAELEGADAAELARAFPEMDDATLPHLQAERGRTQELRWLASRVPLAPLRDREGNTLVHACVGSEALSAPPWELRGLP